MYLQIITTITLAMAPTITNTPDNPPRIAPVPPPPCSSDVGPATKTLFNTSCNTYKSWLYNIIL